MVLSASADYEKPAILSLVGICWWDIQTASCHGFNPSMKFKNLAYALFLWQPMHSIPYLVFLQIIKSKSCIPRFSPGMVLLQEVPEPGKAGQCSFSQSNWQTRALMFLFRMSKAMQAVFVLRDPGTKEMHLRSSFRIHYGQIIGPFPRNLHACGFLYRTLDPSYYPDCLNLIRPRKAIFHLFFLMSGKTTRPY